MNSLAYIPASDGAANASLMTVTNVRSGGATTIQVNTVANVPTKFYASYGTPHTFTDPVTGETITVISEATAVDFAGHIDGTNIEIDEIAPGYTDNGNEVGDIIVIRPVTEWDNNLFNVLSVAHNDDGTLKAGAVDNAAALASDVVTTAKIADSNVTSEKLSSTVAFYATTTQSTNTGTNVPITTYTEVDDMGNNFDPTTGVFTVPYNGFYHLSVAMGVENITGTADARVLAQLAVDDNDDGTYDVFAEGMNFGQTTSFDPIATVSCSRSFSAGDKIRVSMANLTGGTEDCYKSFFSGFLVGRT